MSLRPSKVNMVRNFELTFSFNQTSKVRNVGKRVYEKTEGQSSSWLIPGILILKELYSATTEKKQKKEASFEAQCLCNVSAMSYSDDVFKFINVEILQACKETIFTLSSQFITLCLVDKFREGWECTVSKRPRPNMDGNRGIRGKLYIYMEKNI